MGVQTRANIDKFHAAFQKIYANKPEYRALCTKIAELIDSECDPVLGSFVVRSILQYEGLPEFLEEEFRYEQALELLKNKE